MYKTVITPKFKSFFYSDHMMIAQVIVAALAFCLNFVPLTVVFFSMYLCALLLLNDDLTCAILPVSLLSLSLTRQYGSKPADYIVYLPCVIALAICAVLHLVTYPPVFRPGKLFLPCVAVAVALAAGGAFTISAKDYFAPVTLYYTLMLGPGIAVACLLFYSYTRPPVPIAQALSSQMNYLTLAAVIMTFTQILPFLSQGKFYWFFTWKNTLTTFLLLSSPFAFYTAVKEEHALKAAAHFVLGCAGYVTSAASFSRGGLFFGIPALAVSVVLCLVFAKKRRRILFASIAVAGAATALVTVFCTGLHTTIASKLTFSSSEARVNLWKEAVHNFLVNPVFGAGVGFRGKFFNPQTGNMYWYHSTPFQIIGTTGLVGVAAYAYLYIVKLRLLLSVKSLFGIFLAVSFIGFEAYQLVDAGNFVPVPFVLLVTHIFVIAEAYPFCPREQGDELPLRKEVSIAKA